MPGRQKSILDADSAAQPGGGAWSFRKYRKSFVDDNSLVRATESKSPSGGQSNASQSGLTLGSFHPTRQEREYNTCASELFSLALSVNGSDDEEEFHSEENAVGKESSVARSRPKKRRGYVYGREVEWELQQDVTQYPKSDRKTRLQRRVKNINVNKSGFETRIRLWLMQFSIISISVLYFACFILLNLSYAVLWYIQKNKCCDDPDHTFAQVFDFAIQTSTTVGMLLHSTTQINGVFLVVIE